MSKQTRTTLKGNFNTNDVPTEAQFADVFDSFVSKSDDLSTINGVIKANGSGEIEAANCDDIPDGTTKKGYTVTEQSKLSGIATGATANAKATGAEIDTGTDDTKFATAKAIKDSGVLSSAVAGEIAGLTDKETPLDADVTLIESGADSNAKRKLTWAHIKATLLSYFNGIYLALAGGTLTGDLTLGENTSIALDPALSADGKYTGITRTGTAGTTLAFGDLCYLDPTDSRWELADANIAAGSDGDARGILGICVLAADNDGSATKMLLYGTVRADTAFPTLTVNAPVYVSETAGDVVVAQPTTTDVAIRVIGFGLTGDELFFCPSNDYITHT